MSQKSSPLQLTRSVSRSLTPDNWLLMAKRRWGSYHGQDRLSANDGHQHPPPEHELADLQGEGGSIAPRSGLYVERGDDQYFLTFPFTTIPVPSTFPSWIQSIPLALVPI